MGPDESLSLLRRFEPVIRYTRGELFLPMAVEDYIAASALVQGAGEGRRVRVERGQLTPELLSDLGATCGGARLSSAVSSRRLTPPWPPHPPRTRCTRT